MQTMFKWMMPARPCRVARAAGAALMLVTLTAPAASAEVVSWRVNGETREAIVYAPSSPPAGTPLPLVLAFHGFGDDAHNFQYVDLHGASPDAVVVYFQGLPTRGSYRGWQVERGQDGDRDLKLVDEAVAALRRMYRIDERRIYATGFSNGAGFTYLLWNERPTLFAAFAPVAGRMRPSVAPTERKPVFHIAGRLDGTVRFADQQTAFETAIRVNGGGGHTRGCGDGCTVHGPATPTPVVVWIHDGGHSFPRGTSERIMAFFRDHSLRR
jgi:polyhydroxybutyrate depolymerase